MVFPLEGLAIVEKEPIVDGIITEFTKPALVAELRFFLLRKFLQLKMQWRFRDSNCVQLLHGAGVDDGGIPPLVVGRTLGMIMLGVEEDVGRGVLSGESEVVCSTHDWRQW